MEAGSAPGRPKGPARVGRKDLSIVNKKAKELRDSPVRMDRADLSFGIILRSEFALSALLL